MYQATSTPSEKQTGQNNPVCKTQSYCRQLLTLSCDVGITPLVPVHEAAIDVI